MKKKKSKASREKLKRKRQQRKAEEIDFERKMKYNELNIYVCSASNDLDFSKFFVYDDMEDFGTEHLRLLKKIGAKKGQALEQTFSGKRYITIKRHTEASLLIANYLDLFFLTVVLNKKQFEYVETHSPTVFNLELLPNGYELITLVGEKNYCYDRDCVPYRVLSFG